MNETGCGGTHSEPDNVMRIGRETGATLVLFVSKRLDNDGIVQRACTTNLISISPSNTQFLGLVLRCMW
jgi:hypothetical protein